jgi:hypothetical protein
MLQYSLSFGEQISYRTYVDQMSFHKMSVDKISLNLMSVEQMSVLVNRHLVQYSQTLQPITEVPTPATTSIVPTIVSIRVPKNT